MASTINSDNGVSSGSAGLKSSADSSGVLQLQTNGTAAVTVDTSQNVGIGISTPFTTGTYKTLDVRGTGGGLLNLGTGTNAGGYVYNDGTNMGVYNNQNGVLDFGTNATQRMRIDSSGNVGIGVTPVANFGLLQVNTATNGTAAYLGNGAGVHAFNSAGYYSSAVTLSSAGTWTARSTGSGIISPTNSGTILFYTDTGLTNGNTFSPTERMRIDSSGRFLVNTTSVNNGSLSNFNFTGFSNGIETSWTGTSSIYHVLVRNGNGFLGGVNSNGSTAAFVNLSDYRVKENIQPMQGALQRVSLLKPCTFNFKIDGVASEGFIAHELQEVAPIAAFGEKDAVDEEGNPIYQGVDPSKIVALLTAAIQEQQALITQLQADVAALKGSK